MDKDEVILKTVAATSTVATGTWAWWEKYGKVWWQKRQEKKKELANAITHLQEQLNAFSIDVFNRLDVIESNQKLALNIQRKAFFISDETGGCTYASPMLCKIMGHSESEILGYNWVNTIIEEQRTKVKNEWYESIEEKRVFDMEYSFQKSDGLYQKILCICFHKIVDGIYTGSMGSIEAVGEPTTVKTLI